MDRKKLRGLIEDAREFEERIIPLLAGFYSTQVEFEGLPPGKVGRLKEILRELIDDSKRHEKMLAELLEDLGGSGT
jgi:hypothetical protein